MRSVNSAARLKLTLRRFALSHSTTAAQPAFTTRAALQPDLLHFPPLPLNCHAEAVTLNVRVCVCLSLHVRVLQPRRAGLLYSGS